MKQKKGKNWFMAGTEGTGEYVVLAVTDKGRIGVRKLGEFCRVRIEPNAKHKKFNCEVVLPEEWKTPADGIIRYSTVVSVAEMTDALTTGLKQIATDKIAYADDVPAWLQEAKKALCAAA